METNDSGPGQQGRVDDGGTASDARLHGTAAGFSSSAAAPLVGPGGTLAGIELAASAALKTHDAYWEENFRNEPYHRKDFRYPDYAPAYRLGAADYPDLHGKPFEESEAWLADQWEQVKGESPLTWEQAKPATRAAWERARSNPE